MSVVKSGGGWGVVKAPTVEAVQHPVDPEQVILDRAQPDQFVREVRRGICSADPKWARLIAKIRPQKRGRRGTAQRLVLLAG